MSEPTRPIRRLLHGLILAVVALPPLAAAWGYATDWTFTRLRSTPPVVPPDLAPRLLAVAERFGWCEIHGVHECPVCHPEVAQLPKPPAVTPADRERVRRGLELRPRPANDPGDRRHLRAVRFPSAEAAERAGVDIGLAEIQALTETVAAPGEVGFDPTRVTRQSARAAGVVWRVLKQVGDPVRRGDVLAMIDATDVGKAKAELLLALVQARQAARVLADLKSAPGTPAARLRDAEAAAREADIRLDTAAQQLANLGLPVRVADHRPLTPEQSARAVQFLGLPAELTRDLDPKSAPATLLPVVAARDGVVLAREAVAGEVVDATRPLFTVGDVGHVRLTLNVFPDDAKVLRPGQEVTFRPDGDPLSYRGPLTRVGTAADEKTRTVPAWADLANDRGRLRAFTPGVGQVALRHEPEAVVVPADAVQTDGRSWFVFVRHRDYLAPDGPKTFFARSVRPGFRDGAAQEILAGVVPGEVVATRGSGMLLKEIMKTVVSDR